MLLHTWKNAHLVQLDRSGRQGAADSLENSEVDEKSARASVNLANYSISGF